MKQAHRIAQECLLMRSRRLSRVVTKLYLERMEGVGLSVAQFTLLAAIGSNPGVRAADLAPALDLEKSTVSRELAALTGGGLVLIEALGVNRRASMLSGVSTGVLLNAAYVLSGLCAALAGLGGDRRQHRGHPGECEHQPDESLSRGGPDRAEDRQDRGQRSQHHNEVHEQRVGRQTVDHRHCANATSFRTDRLGES